MKFENYINKHVSDLYDFTDKKRTRDYHVKYMLNRTRKIFKYNNLPETIPERSLELFLQLNGNCCITKINGELYALTGGLGGEPDPYYMPTLYTVANPALKFSANLKINEDCVIIPNDTLYIGLYPLFNRYATQLVENELSIKMVLKNSRIFNIMSASDDKTFESAKKYLQDIDEGKDGVIASNEFFEGIKTQEYTNTSASNTIKNLIEFEQYTRASWYNEIGLNANYNMKRESLNSNESQLNDDMLKPLIDDMLDCRKEAIEKVNKMFGTNITVELDSEWRENEKENQLEQDILEAQIEEPQNEPQTEPKDDGKRGEEDE